MADGAGSIALAMDAAPERRVFLDIVLHPYRSLPPRGFTLLMVGLGCLSLMVGVLSVLAGVWPVFGFFGLDVLLIYIALRLSYRAARQHEAVRLTDEALTIERVSVRGARQVSRFEPFWLRVQYDETDKASAVTLASHGNRVAVGSFLAPEAKKSLVGELRQALSRWRAAIGPGG